MEDKIKADEESPVEIKTGSGALLAIARKKQNRTVEEIAAELNLSVTQIKTIELDQTEGLPESTYVRGYIRSYAKLLGLDPEQVLENYLNPNWQKTSSLEDLPRGLGSADHSDSSPRFGLGKALMTLLLVGIVAYLWFSGAITRLIGSDQQTAPSSIVVAQSNQFDDQSSTPSAESTQVDTPASAADSPDEATAVSVEDNRLVLNFAQTSWVDIRDGNDNRLAYKSYAEGEVLSVNSAGSMSVFIGNAGGVSAQYNGEQFDISPHREGVYAKFNLGED